MSSNISEFNFSNDLTKAYGLYAMSVIKGRALPNLQDGLKPVQRRILFSMYSSGYRYNKPFKKCMKIIGEVLGRFHPHGDGSVYEALVNLTQPFSISVPLVSGYGNFGSSDGDNAAAPRYTQARLSYISEFMLADYEKDTVNMQYNFDESEQIPEVLPVQFPNLLVNGSSGIAVGMATNIPPHNLKEVMEATIALLENPNLTVKDLMQFIKGPDFPSNGEFFGGEELVKAYETGRGRVILKGNIEIENYKNKEILVIKSIPYQVLKPKLIERIIELINQNELEISDIRDESSQEVRVAIELKKDANIEITRQKLFQLTQMQTSFNFNMVAIDKDTPKLCGLIDILSSFLHFREEVVIKRAEYILNKTNGRIYILNALALATKMLDFVIETIRKSKNSKEAEQNLINIVWQKEQFEEIWNLTDYPLTETYQFSEIQAKGILDLRLSKLTQLERFDLFEQIKELNLIILEQKKILADKEYRHSIMKKEFEFIKANFSTPRKTLPIAYLDDCIAEDLIEKEQIIIVNTTSGYIKRMNLEEYKVQNRGGKGKIVHKKNEDPIASMFIMDTLTEVLFFTNLGKVFSRKAYQIPQGTATSRGRAAINLFNLQNNEQITTILPLINTNENSSLFFTTTFGTIRKNKIEDFLNIRSNGKIAMKLENENTLHSVTLTNPNDEMLLTSSNGNAIRFAVEDIRYFESRNSQGIKGITLEEKDYVVGATKISPNSNAEILSITENGFGKRSNFNEYSLIRRGGKGSKVMKITAKTGLIIEAIYIEEQDELLILTQKGQMIRIKAEDIRKTARVASGVSLINLNNEDKVLKVIRINNEFIDKSEQELEEK